MGRRTKLTPEVQEAIVEAIRRGAFDYVAAESSGVTARTFQNWIRWGEKGNPRYFPFFREVRRARAEARKKAEAKVYEEDAFKWLRYGPGRERPGEPGWTESSQYEITGPTGQPVVFKIITSIPSPEDSLDDNDSAPIPDA